MRKPKQPSNIVLVEEYSPTREIAELQLNKLRDLARERLLTYEEAKIFDLLTKNLYLAKGEPTTIVESPSEITSQVEKEDLLRLVQSIDPDEVSVNLNIIEDAKDGSDKKTDK